MRDRLGSLPLFADLDDAQLDRLAAATTEFEAPEGTRELGPGDIFGERALLGEDIERTARVRARTDVRCLAIARPELERLLAEDPRLAQRLSQLSA